MSLPVIEPVVKFHLSLNVANLNRSIAFYRVLFGFGPAKHHDDYAKFELEDPPVVFSLVPRAPGAGGSLSHIGLRVSETAGIAPYRDRLAAAGICTDAQDGTVCGYARQDKVWVPDPDGNFWEIYTVHEDVDPVSVRRSLDGPVARIDVPECNTSSEASETSAWEHYVTEGAPERIPHPDASLDEVRLTGTFNADLDDAGRSRLVAEAFRVLKPGGKVISHGLMSDAVLPSQPKLPGMAALVKRVPTHAEASEALEAAGFVGVQFVKYTEKPWFEVAGVGLREVKLTAYRPAVGGEGERQVLYKGPFTRATVDGGHVFTRGERVAVTEALWQRLRLGPTADQFLFLDAAEAACGV